MNTTFYSYKVVYKLTGTTLTLLLVYNGLDFWSHVWPLVTPIAKSKQNLCAVTVTINQYYKHTKINNITTPTTMVIIREIMKWNKFENQW